MKFSCTKENLLKALTCTGHISGKQVNLPILQNILISMKNTETKIIATNLEIAISAHVRAKVEEDGEYTVPARVFLEYMMNIPGERVDVSSDSAGLHVALGTSKTVLKGLTADEFPPIPQIEADAVYECDAKELLQALHQVLFATSKSDVRIELSGVLFRCIISEVGTMLVVVATDSFRLAEKRIKISSIDMKEKQVIIPSQTISELTRIISVYNKDVDKVVITISDNQVMFECGGVQLISRLIDGQYPNYEHIIPTDSKTSISCLREDIIQQIKGASLFTMKGINVVKVVCSPKESKLLVSSLNAQTGEHDGVVIGEGVGENVELPLNYRYVLDGLQAMTQERVVLYTNSNETPLLIRPQNDKSYLYLIMPIRQ